VVTSNTHRQPVSGRNDVRIIRSAAAPVFKTWDLSDHFPVMGEFDHRLPIERLRPAKAHRG